MDTHIAVARFEGAVKTVTASPYISAVLSFAAHPHWLTCKGKLSALSSLLSAAAKPHGFLRTLEPGTRDSRIRDCVNSPLKKEEI